MSAPIEALHDRAHEIVPDDLPTLARWLLGAAPEEYGAAFDGTLAELGVPEPDYDEGGEPVPGSVLRKLLYWTAIGVAVELLQVHPRPPLAGTRMSGAVPEAVKRCAVQAWIHADGETIGQTTDEMFSAVLADSEARAALLDALGGEEHAALRALAELLKDSMYFQPCYGPSINPDRAPELWSALLKVRAAIPDTREGANP